MAGLSVRVSGCLVAGREGVTPCAGFFSPGFAFAAPAGAGAGFFPGLDAPVFLVFFFCAMGLGLATKGKGL
jgi:hypothetical protein